MEKGSETNLKAAVILLLGKCGVFNSWWWIWDNVCWWQWLGTPTFKLSYIKCSDVSCM